MPSVYDEIRRAVQEGNHGLDASWVYRVAGTLIGAYGSPVPYWAVQAEVQRAAVQAAQDQARQVAAQQAALEQQADVVVPLDDDGAHIDYKELDAALERGICPRCSQRLKDVKLADYTPARYCQPCRIALWEP
jgi:hypothetical protein